MDPSSSFRIELTSAGKPTCEVTLQLATEILEGKESVMIGGRKYTVEGDEKGLAAFHDQFKKLTSNEFSSVTEFKASLGEINATSQSTIEVAAPILHPVLSQKIVANILRCDGSKQEVMRIFSEIPPEKRVNIEFLMDIAQALAKGGAIIKADHFFSLVPLRQDMMDSCFFRMGNAMLGIGERTSNIDALNCSYKYFSSIKFNSPSPPEGLQLHIDSLMASLRQIIEGEPSNRKKAQEILDCIRIKETPGMMRSIGSKEELQTLRGENPEIGRAFKLADDVQLRVDTDIDPRMAPPGRVIPIIKEGETILMHVNITGTRTPGEPFVILEGGLGMFSADWQHVQKNMPKNIQVMSYDRAGTGWSGPSNEKPIAENALDNLELLLKKLDIPGPYIFVGHSYGGFLGQLFALRHPDKVSGLVMVDSAIEDVLPGKEDEKRIAFEYLPPAARNLQFQSDRGQFFDEVTGPVVHRVANRTTNLATYQEEVGQFVPTAQLLKDKLSEIPADKVPFACPMKVILATKKNIEGREDDDPESADSVRFRKFQEGNRMLSARSSKGELVVTEKSDHFIMWHDPLIVVEQTSSLFK